MTVRTTERQMTNAEVDLLRPRLTGFPRKADELKEFLGEIASLTFGLSFFTVLIWLLVAWLVGLVVDFDFGWNSPYGSTIFWSIVALALAYTVYEIQKTNMPAPERIRSLLADIEARKVIVEEHSISAAKVLQEEEHGGLFYFLLTSEDRVYVAFDYESQGLGVDGQNPLSSAFRPKSKLRIQKTPHTGATLVEEFDGEILEVPKPIPMKASPSKWPEPEEFVDIPWARIEEVYSE